MAIDFENLSQTYSNEWFDKLGLPEKEFELPNISTLLCSADCATCRDIFNIGKQKPYPTAILDDQLTSEAIPIPLLELKKPFNTSGLMANRQTTLIADKDSCVTQNSIQNRSDDQSLQMGKAICIEDSSTYPLSDNPFHGPIRSHQLHDMFGSDLSHVNPFINNFSPTQQRPSLLPFENLFSQIANSSVDDSSLPNLDLSEPHSCFCADCLATHNQFQEIISRHAMFNHNKDIPNTGPSGNAYGALHFSNEQPEVETHYCLSVNSPLNQHEFQGINSGHAMFNHNEHIPDVGPSVNAYGAFYVHNENPGVEGHSYFLADCFAAENQFQELDSGQVMFSENEVTHTGPSGDAYENLYLSHGPDWG